MVKKKTDNSSYKSFYEELSAGRIGTQYVFCGEERYLLEYCKKSLREKLLASGTDDFNYRFLDGKSIKLSDLYEAVDAVPLFAERTLVEVSDFSIESLSESDKKELISLLSHLPEYVCVLFLYETVEFKIDGRSKLGQELKKLLTVIQFDLQEQNELVKWIRRRFRSEQKQISPQDAEYLAFITGGEMTNLVTEIEKLCSYSHSDVISRKEIDQIVDPVAETEAFKLSDALINGNYKEACSLLSILVGMKVAPHKIMFWIGRDFRWLFGARMYLDLGKNADDLMSLCGIRFRFQAENLMRSARKKSMNWCRKALESCCQAAFDLNNSTEGEETIKGLLITLSQ